MMNIDRYIKRKRLQKAKKVHTLIAAAKGVEDLGILWARFV
jgi:hypothetical protein